MIDTMDSNVLPTPLEEFVLRPQFEKLGGGWSIKYQYGTFNMTTLYQ